MSSLLKTINSKQAQTPSNRLFAVYLMDHAYFCLLLVNMCVDGILKSTILKVYLIRGMVFGRFCALFLFKFYHYQKILDALRVALIVQLVNNIEEDRYFRN